MKHIRTFEGFLNEANQQDLNQYTVGVRTDYGTLSVDDVMAKNERYAFDAAIDAIETSLGHAKLDEIDLVQADKKGLNQYRVDVRTDYGTLSVDNVMAKNERSAFDAALKEIEKSLGHAKVDEIDQIN